MTENERRIIEAVSISEIYNTYIVPLNPQKYRKIQEGGMAICPFHTDTDPSFRDWREKKIFRCFGCGAVGNVIKMYQQYLREYKDIVYSYNDTIIKLSTLYNVELEYTEQGDLVQESVFDQARNKLQVQVELHHINDMRKINYANFKHANRKIKKYEGLTAEQRLNMYSELDLMYARQLAEEKIEGTYGK